jgi:hypothetical protein
MHEQVRALSEPPLPEWKGMDTTYRGLMRRKAKVAFQGILTAQVNDARSTKDKAAIEWLRAYKAKVLDQPKP